MTKKKKLLILIACECVLLFTMVTGTIAWLTAESGTITNTFTPSDISVSLTEANNGINYNFQMIPGATIPKDPKVDVKTNVACYVFVEITKENNLDKYIEWEIAEGWTALMGYSNVYYRELSADANDLSVIKGDTVTVKDSVVKDDMSALYNADGSVKADALPKLVFTAHAIQKDYLTSGGQAVDSAEGAWAILKGN